MEFWYSGDDGSMKDAAFHVRIMSPLCDYSDEEINGLIDALLKNIKANKALTEETEADFIYRLTITHPLMADNGVTVYIVYALLVLNAVKTDNKIEAFEYLSKFKEIQAKETGIKIGKSPQVLGGKKSGKNRRKESEKFDEYMKIRKVAEELMQGGVDKRNVASILAQRFGCSASWIRRILKNQTDA